MASLIHGNPDLGRDTNASNTHTYLCSPFLVRLNLVSTYASLNCNSTNAIRSGEGNIEGYLHNSIILIDGDEIGVGINLGNLTIRENYLVGFQGKGSILNCIQCFIPIHTIYPVLQVTLLFFDSFLT